MKGGLMEYTCSVCSQTVAGDLIVYKEHTEKHILDLVKHDHPEWVDEKGLCQQCYKYYKGEIDGSVFGDAPCAIRIRKLKKLINAIKGIFGQKHT